jgi:hypothetical protein
VKRQPNPLSSEPGKKADLPALGFTPRSAHFLCHCTLIAAAVVERNANSTRHLPARKLRHQLPPASLFGPRRMTEGIVDRTPVGMPHGSVQFSVKYAYPVDTRRSKGNAKPPLSSLPELDGRGVRVCWCTQGAHRTHLSKSYLVLAIGQFARVQGVPVVCEICVHRSHVRQHVGLSPRTHAYAQRPAAVCSVLQRPPSSTIDRLPARKPTLMPSWAQPSTR